MDLAEQLPRDILNRGVAVLWKIFCKVIFFIKKVVLHANFSVVARFHLRKECDFCPQVRNILILFLSLRKAIETKKLLKYA